MDEDAARPTLPFKPRQRHVWYKKCIAASCRDKPEDQQFTIETVSDYHMYISYRENT
jgi:hypothetical protein